MQRAATAPCATANQAEPRHVRTAATGQRPASRRSRHHALPICTASLSLHALIIVVLAAVGIAAAELPDELLLTVGPPPVEEFLLSETDFETAEPTDQFDTVADEIPSELIDPGMASLGELATTAALADPSATGEPTVAAGTLGGDLGALFGESGAGLAEFDDGLGGAPTAKFFGSEIEGRRIVFVLDNSGSMQGGRLETVIAELLRCVDSPPRRPGVLRHLPQRHGLPDALPRPGRPLPPPDARRTNGCWPNGSTRSSSASAMRSKKPSPPRR